MKRAYLLILASFVWLIGGALAINPFMDPKSSWGDIVMIFLLVGFAILFLAGTGTWSKAKGYHPIVGVILGWIGPLGLLVLVFLPDKS